MSEELICAHCGKPIKDGEDVAYPFVGSDNPTHVECAHDAAMDEVADVYHEQGAKGLEDLDKQSDIQSRLFDVNTQLDGEPWER